MNFARHILVMVHAGKQHTQSLCVIHPGEKIGMAQPLERLPGKII